MKKFLHQIIKYKHRYTDEYIDVEMYKSYIDSINRDIIDGKESYFTRLHEYRCSPEDVVEFKKQRALYNLPPADSDLIKFITSNYKE